MARTFNAQNFIYVPAAGHPKNAEYRVAWGNEKWNDEEGTRNVAVLKTQMVYDGNVAGMLSPSFLLDSQDDVAVQVAMKLLREGKYGTNSKTIKDTLVLVPGASLEEMESEIATAKETLYETNRRIFQKRMKEKPIIDIEVKGKFGLNREGAPLTAVIFRVEITASHTE